MVKAACADAGGSEAMLEPSLPQPQVPGPVAPPAPAACAVAPPVPQPPAPPREPAPAAGMGAAVGAAASASAEDLTGATLQPQRVHNGKGTHSQADGERGRSRSRGAE
eukprot:12570552-Alexandrium_andersonii.AAC.2